ncbi:MAG: hypothetical protein VW576_03385 [Opitutae bacterium]
MFIILAVSLFGSGAISIVWLRMEISATAKNCGKLEDQREMVARELRELRGKKSRMLRPSMIAQLVEGRLSVPSSQRTVHVTRRELSSYQHSEIARSNELGGRDILTRQ